MTIEHKATIQVCGDCIQWLANADTTGLDYHYTEEEAAARLAAVQAGELTLLADYGPRAQLVPGDAEKGDEFSQSPCDCCGCRLHGARHAVEILAENGLSAEIKFGDWGGPYQTELAPVKESPLSWQLRGLQYTATGYGAKIPTVYMINYRNRWRRVYCAVFSNSGTTYVMISGHKVVVDIYRTGS